jgi:hypothetical protein
MIFRNSYFVDGLRKRDANVLSSGSRHLLQKKSFLKQKMKKKFENQMNPNNDDP